MGDLAHAHVSEFREMWRVYNMSLIGSHGGDRNAVNFRYKMRVILKVERAISLCLGALTPAP